MIEVLKDFPDNVAAFACHGHITKQDYATVLVPAVEQALKNHDKVRLYYEIAADLLRWHRSEHQHGRTKGRHRSFAEVGTIGGVTDVEWIKHMVHFLSFLMPGTTKLFTLADAAQARQWIRAE